MPSVQFNVTKGWDMLVKDYAQYQGLAIRTMRGDDPYLQKVLHCSMGMVGEVGELLELPDYPLDPRVGEVGDCMWYAANLCEVLGLKMSDLLEAATKDSDQNDLRYRRVEMRAMLWASRLTDIVKKSVFYGKELPVDLVTNCLKFYILGLVDLSVDIGIDPLHAATANIAKLEKRYPDLIFDAEKAINRDYVAEGKAAGINIV